MKIKKMFSVLIPIAILWLSFYVGSLLKIDDGWYQFPYVFTCLFLFIISVVYSIDTLLKF